MQEGGSPEGSGNSVDSRWYILELVQYLLLPISFHPYSNAVESWSPLAEATPQVEAVESQEFCGAPGPGVDSSCPSLHLFFPSGTFSITNTPTDLQVDIPAAACRPDQHDQFPSPRTHEKDYWQLQVHLSHVPNWACPGYTTNDLNKYQRKKINGGSKSFNRIEFIMENPENSPRVSQ